MLEVVVMVGGFAMAFNDALLRFFCALFVAAVSGVLGSWARAISTQTGQVNLFSRQTLVPGITAALAVPLFLAVADSGTVHNVLVVLPYPYKDLMVLIGFCIVAGYSSVAFLDKLSDRVLAEVAESKKVSKSAAEDAKTAKEAAETAAEVSAEVAENVNNEATAQIAGVDRGDNAFQSARAEHKLSDDQRVVLQAFYLPRPAIRSISGVARDAALSRAEAKRSLESLVDQGLLEHHESVAQGVTLYRLRNV